MSTQATRALALACTGVALVAVVVLLATGGTSRHHVYVTVPDATNVVAGQFLNEGGQHVGVVGEITPARGGRAVRLRLDVDDDAWPLPRDSTFSLRWGGTVSFDNRYVALQRGRGSASLSDDAQLAPAAFKTPVEFDQLLTAFTPPVRRDIRALVHRGGDAFSAARVPFAAALRQAPPALAEANGVIGDLHADTRALATLVHSTSDVVQAVHAADPTLGDLVTGAATTLQATADRATELQQTLDATPRTLGNARRVLAHADKTLAAAGELTTRIAPGVQEVRKIASPLNSVLGTVVDVGPTAHATLASARRATPSINPLLTKVRELSPSLEKIGTKTVEQLKCIRPYTPDIVAFFTNWGDFLSSTDGRDKYIRATVQQFLPAPMNVATYTSGEAAKAWPGLRYAFPRPPGYNAGQTWFLPECGAGPDALDPNKDPESANVHSLRSMPALKPILPTYRRGG